MNKHQLRTMVRDGQAKPFAEWVAGYSVKLVHLLQTRNNLSQADLEYLAETAAKLKDDRLKACIATLIGWGDDERAELETFMAIAVEVLKRTPPSRIREAARLVNIRVAMTEAEAAQARFECNHCHHSFNDHEHPGEGEGVCPMCGSPDTTTKEKP